MTAKTTRSALVLVAAMGISFWAGIYLSHAQSVKAGVLNSGYVSMQIVNRNKTPIPPDSQVIGFSCVQEDSSESCFVALKTETPY